MYRLRQMVSPSPRSIHSSRFNSIHRLVLIPHLLARARAVVVVLMS